MDAHGARQSALAFDDVACSRAHNRPQRRLRSEVTLLGMTSGHEGSRDVDIRDGECVRTRTRQVRFAASRIAAMAARVRVSLRSGALGEVAHRDAGSDAGPRS